jgi:hypothetical protein
MRQSGWVIVALLLSSCLVASAAAQEDRGSWNQDYDPHVVAIGLAAGMSSGTGLAIRWPAFPQVMMSLTGGALGISDDLAWNVGIEAHYVLRQVGRLRFLAGPAFAIYSDDTDGESNKNASLGVGIEYLVRPRLSAKIDLGFTYLSDRQAVYPLPQAGLYLYF